MAVSFARSSLLLRYVVIRGEFSLYILDSFKTLYYKLLTSVDMGTCNHNTIPHASKSLLPRGVMVMSAKRLSPAAQILMVTHLKSSKSFESYNHDDAPTTQSSEAIQKHVASSIFARDRVSGGNILPIHLP